MKFKSIYKINYLSRIEVLNKTKFNKASFIISTYVIYLFLLILQPKNLCLPINSEIYRKEWNVRDDKQINEYLVQKIGS